jgi:quinol-cytochrome oxidoreductase complex cytochrome b subunit
MTERNDQGEARGGLAGRIWKSIFRGPIYPRDDRDRKWLLVNNLILHLRPIRLPARSLKFTHTFGLGGMSAVLFLLLAATGVLLMFAYEPSPGRAYESIVSLQNQVLFGKLVRNVHHWSANLLILIAFLHLLRVYFTGGFHVPRQFNWVIGVVLLLCVVVSNFTGYLLPWDQLSYWAITIVTGMIGYVPFIGEWLQTFVRGGAEISGATLIYFYTFHTTVVPVLLITFMAWHFWRVRKAHGVVYPRAPGEEREEKPEYVLTLPNLLLRELSVALCLIALIMVASVMFNAPLDEAANAGMSPNPAKAPWYFLGLQELLLHFHPLFAVVIIPLLAATALVGIPYLRYEDDAEGVWFMSQRGRSTAVIAAITSLALTATWVVLDEYWIDYSAWLPGVPQAIADGLLPVTALLAALAGFTMMLRKKFAASRDEAMQALFVFLTVAFIVLTVTGVWFRGAGMALTWPWNF